MRNNQVMTTGDYVKKHKLNVSDNFNHATFVNDLKKDFNKLLTSDIKKNGRITEPRFAGTVKSIKDKFDSINNKTKGNISDKLFGYFYASVIIPKKDSFFKPFM